MKKVVSIFIFGLIILQSDAQINELNRSSEYELITVYLNGAEVKKTAQVELRKGKNQVTMTGLSDQLVSSSVQVSVNPEVEILGVVSQINYLDADELEPRIKIIKDSLDFVKQRIKKVDNTL